MKQAILFNFEVDKESNSIYVKRSFNAPIDLVWAAWTEADILDKWWAPKPYQTKTKSMDFKEGGQRLYAMVGPNGEEHWALADYNSISPKTNFKYLDAFCDNSGKLNPDFPRSDWNVDFIESNGVTTVYVTIKHEKLADLEMTIEMGFKEGFIMALENLDQYIKDMI